MGIVDKAKPAAGSKAAIRAKAAKGKKAIDEQKKVEMDEIKESKKAAQADKSAATKIKKDAEKRYDELRAEMNTVTGLDKEIDAAFAEFVAAIKRDYEDKGRRVPLHLMLLFVAIKGVLKIIDFDKKKKK